MKMPFVKPVCVRSKHRAEQTASTAMQPAHCPARIVSAPPITDRNDGAVHQNEGRNINRPPPRMFRKTGKRLAVLCLPGIMTGKAQPLQASTFVREGWFGRVFNPCLKRNSRFTIHQSQLAEEDVGNHADLNRVCNSASPVLSGKRFASCPQKRPISTHSAALSHLFASQRNLAEFAGAQLGPQRGQHFLPRVVESGAGTSSGPLAKSPGVPTATMPANCVREASAHAGTACALLVHSINMATSTRIGSVSSFPKLTQPTSHQLSLTQAFQYGYEKNVEIRTVS